MLYLDINTLLPNEILYFNDMLSMAHSMEVRTPFLDYRLAELACSIPGSLKIRDGKLKYILRRVAARYVTQEILDRPKEGFVLPKNTWLREGMSGMLNDVLAGASRGPPAPLSVPSSLPFASFLPRLGGAPVPIF